MSGRQSAGPFREGSVGWWGSSGGGSSSGSVNKVGLTLLGAGLVAIIGIFGPPLLDDDDDNPPNDAPAPAASVSEQAPPTVASAAPTLPSNASPPRTQASATGEVTLTVTAYGLPARISAKAQDPNARFIETVREVCSTDIYPAPCVTDYKMNRDTVVVVTAGNPLAGYWSSLDSVKGPGCNLGRTGQDLTCTLTVATDMEVVARFYGSEVVGVDYFYPACPKQRGNNPPAFATRCQ